MINTRMSASSCRTENEVSHETKIQAEKIRNLLLDACAPSSLFTLSAGEDRSSNEAAHRRKRNRSALAELPPACSTLSRSNLSLFLSHDSLKAKHKYTESWVDSCCTAQSVIFPACTCVRRRYLESHSPWQGESGTSWFCGTCTFFWALNGTSWFLGEIVNIYAPMYVCMYVLM